MQGIAGNMYYESTEAVCLFDDVGRDSEVP